MRKWKLTRPGVGDCGGGRSPMWWIGMWVLLLPISAQAATPNAGTLFQRAQPSHAPKPSNTHTGLRIEMTPSGLSTSKVRFVVKHIEITGNTLFQTNTLHGLVASGEGKQLTLGMLQKLARKITDYYHAHGYVISRAGIPAQTVKHGVVLFKVVEARYGKISLKNHSPVRDRLLRATLAPLHSGQFIDRATLNRALLLLSDIPGVHAKSALKAGSRVDTSDLNIDAMPQPRVTGSISANNYGSPSTGIGELGAGLTVNDPMHIGDELDLYLMTAGTGMVYGSVSYAVVVNGTGTRVGTSYASMHYSLGGAQNALRAYGTAKTLSAWLRQPVIRSRPLNLYARAQVNQKRLRDHIDASATRTDRRLNDGALSLSGDDQEHWLGTASVDTWRISWTTGHLAFDDPAAAASDAATARTAGQFSAWNLTLSHTQQISSRDELYVLVSGQGADKNLDSVMKVVVGGTMGLRGYDNGVLSADEGYLTTVELRHSFTERLRGRVFMDGQHVNVNAKPWSADRNVYTLGDAGCGLDVYAPHRWHLQGYFARPVGVVPTNLGKRNVTRVWVQLSKMF